MTLQIDLRDRPEGERRTLLFETLEEAKAGDELKVVADRDIDPQLVRYQIERDRALDWEHAHPDAEPRELRVRKEEPLDEGELGTIDVRDLKPQRRHEVLLEIVKTARSDAPDEDVVTRYDVRDIPKRERHPTIHHRYGTIPEGATMEIVAPHEPRSLRREFRQQYGSSFTWEVVESEPGRCRVRITKGADTGEDPGSADSEADAVPSVASDGDAIETAEELDVRDLPPARRHERIFDAYAHLDGGEGFVLVNDHDPKPLYHQFEAEAGAEFRWEYRRRDPGEFRVLIGKAEETGDDAIGGETGAPF